MGQPRPSAGEPDRRRGWRDAPFLIAGAGLLGLALFLEDVMAAAHGVPVEDLHTHTDVPIGVHGFAAASILVVLFRTGIEVWSAARQRRLHWKVAVLVGVGGLFAAGQAITAAVVALALAFAMGVLDRGR